VGDGGAGGFLAACLTSTGGVMFGQRVGPMRNRQVNTGTLCLHISKTAIDYN